MKEMTWDEAILKVLKEKQAPMKYADIADEIVKQKLRTKVGATPAITVNTYLNGDKLSGLVMPLQQRGVYVLKSVLDNNPTISTACISDSSVEEEEKNVDDALITAYGRFWSRSLWEENKNRLYGSSAKTPNASGVDFADMPGIYLLHKGYTVIYVGQAQRISARLIDHTKDDKRNRWDNFSWFCICPIDDQADNPKESTKSIGTDSLLDTLEALLIETLGPERNKKVGNGFDDKEFEQNSAPEFIEKMSKASKSK